MRFRNDLSFLALGPLLLPFPKPAHAETDLAALVGNWNGKEGCESGAFSVIVKLVPKGRKKYRLFFSGKPLGGSGQGSSGSIALEQQPRRFKVTYKMGPGGPIPIDSLDGFADLQEDDASERTTFKTNFGMLDAMAQLTGWYKVSEDARRIEFEFSSRKGADTDRCKGVVHRAKTSAKKK